MKLAINQFALDNHTPTTGSHFSGSWEELVALVLTYWDQREPGFTDGVWEVPVPQDRFWVGVIPAAAAGDSLSVCFAPRREGEDSVLLVRAASTAKQPAVTVRLAVYSKDILGQDQTDPESDFEVVTILAEGTEKVPMEPTTMARNFLGLEGGTKGKFTAEQFAESIIFWATHVRCGGRS